MYHSGSKRSLLSHTAGQSVYVCFSPPKSSQWGSFPFGNLVRIRRAPSVILGAHEFLVTQALLDPSTRIDTEAKEALQPRTALSPLDKLLQRNLTCSTNRGALTEIFVVTYRQDLFLFAVLRTLRFAVSTYRHCSRRPLEGYDRTPAWQWGFRFLFHPTQSLASSCRLSERQIQEFIMLLRNCDVGGQWHGSRVGNVGLMVCQLVGRPVGAPLWSRLK